MNKIGVSRPRRPGNRRRAMKFVGPATKKTPSLRGGKGRAALEGAKVRRAAPKTKNHTKDFEQGLDQSANASPLPDYSAVNGESGEDARTEKGRSRIYRSRNRACALAVKAEKQSPSPNRARKRGPRCRAKKDAVDLHVL